MAKFSSEEMTSAAKMNYLEEKVNPVIQAMIACLLQECPSDPEQFMLHWLIKQDLYDRGGINTLEDAEAQQAEINELKDEVRRLKQVRKDAKAHYRHVIAEERAKRGLPNRPPLPREAIERIRREIKRAAYVGFHGMDLHVLFSRFDIDGSGELDFDEIRRALRRTLRISPRLVPDHEITAFCAIIDADYSDTVDVKEFVDFVNDTTHVVRR